MEDKDLFLAPDNVEPPVLVPSAQVAGIENAVL